MNGVISRRDELAVVESEYRAVVLDLTRLDEPPLVLTESAAAIWWCIDGANTETEIISKVARLFGLAQNEIGEQVRAFLEDLSLRRFIVRT